MDHIRSGLILSTSCTSHKNGLQHTLWLASDSGALKAVSAPQPYVFFIKECDEPKAKKIIQQQNLQVTLKPTKLKNFAHEDVSACYFNSTHHAFKAKQAFKESSLTTYEHDIRATDQFLMERFIRGSAWLQGQQAGSNEFHQAKFKPNPELQVTLKALSVDVECSQHGILYSIGLYAGDVEKVLMIGPQSQSELDWLECVADESVLLQRFIECVQHYDPDVLIGWNVVDFDFQLLCYRCEQLGVPFSIGRQHELATWREKQLNPLVIPGRVVLDGISVLKNASYHFTRYGLDYVASEVLGDKKLIENKNKMSEINRLFAHDKPQLARYNLKDCQLVWDIFNKLNLLEFCVARSKLTGLPLDRLGGSVAAFTNLYLPLLHRSGFVAPNLEDQTVNFDSPGGYVMDSAPGLYQNVVVLDFKSLYPSIIRSFKIDPLGLIQGLVEDGDTIEGFNGAQFSRTQHHLPELVAQLAKARQVAKSEGDQQLQHAIKIIMNSLYGVLGSKGCRFYDPRLSSSITMRGHEIMKQTRHWIERQGYTVIYGDTDSTFVALDEHLSEQACHTKAQELATHINNQWQVALSAKGLTSFLELEYESLYKPFFMPYARNKDVGTKKRYVGLLAQDNFALTFKGMESVRSDWTELAQCFQKDLYLSLFKGEDINNVINRYSKSLLSGELNHQLVYRKRLGKSPELYTKSTPPHVKAAKQAQQQYQKGDMVEYIITPHGPKVVADAMAPDLSHYFEKQLLPVIRDLERVNLVEASNGVAQQALW